MNDNAWQKSSYCAQGSNCVEIAAVGEAVLLRESSDPEQVISLTPAALAAFVAAVKAGRFDEV